MKGSRVLSVLLLGVLTTACTGKGVGPRSHPGRTAPPLAPVLRVLKTLHGTQPDGGIFTDRTEVDTARGLLLATEQFETGTATVDRTRVIDTTTWRTIRHIPGLLRGEDPIHGLVYTENPTLNELEVYAVDTGRRVTALAEDAGGADPALDLDGNRVYVLRSPDIDVYSVPEFALVRHMPGAGGEQIAFDPAAGVLYVKKGDSTDVYAAGDGHLIRTIRDGSLPGWLIPGSEAFVVTDGSYKSSTMAHFTVVGARVWSVHVNRGIARPAVDGPRSLVFDALNDLTYSEFAATPDPPDSVEARSAVDGHVLARITVPDGPVYLLDDPAHRRLFVTTINSLIIVMGY